MSSQLFPEVIDNSTLGTRSSQALYLPIGVEGEADSGEGITGVEGTIYAVTRPSEADTYFGTDSPLAAMVKFLIGRGIAPVYAVISAKGSTPTTQERQTAWEYLESRSDIRIRLTDSEIQADLDALADSCDNANSINNKQFAFGGLPSGTSKANLISAAEAINNRRFVLVGPGVYDVNGNLLGGSFAAAACAAEVAKNSDPSDDMDTMLLPNLTAIEKESNGNPIFRIKVVSGVPTNEFEDLLQGGVSPLMPGRNGGVAISHLRTTYSTDRSYDALMTRIIVDQIFVLVREYALDFNVLRHGNTPLNRNLLASGVNALLLSHNDWIKAIVQADGSAGYNVTVTPSTDERQMILSYQGRVVRNTQTLMVAAELQISV